MRRYTPLFALMLGISTLLFSFTIVQAAPDLTTTLSSLTPTLMVEAPADVTSPTPVTQRSWGSLKAIYRGDREDAATQTSTTAKIQKPGATPNATFGGDWSNNIISEAYYTLNKYRTGTSGVIYQGQALSDWPYVTSDPGALSTMTSYIGGTYWRGGIDGTWNGGSRGGYCKFFVDLVLYRSSYGIGGGYHLVLPAGTYSYGGYMPAYGVQQATRGMVIQRGGSYPHSAIVVANLGWGLDLIDSNYIGKDGNFVIARHAMSWGELSGFTAYRATYMRQF